MSSPSEPSVESMAAEIRVLRVGSKQLTLSAARQLDHVDRDDVLEFKPFGRGGPRIDPKPEADLIEVIGSLDWILVRASARALKF